MGEGRLIMTEQEKRFLEKLGIAPAPWYDNSREVVDANNRIVCIPYNMQVCDFICHLPEMFLSLWNNIFFISKLDELFYNKLKSKLWNESFKLLSENIKIIESTTGKTFEQLLEIWEACK